jgi:hypothetical protein
MTHPYLNHEDTGTWKILNQAIDELVANKDLAEQTNQA